MSFLRLLVLTLGMAAAVPAAAEDTAACGAGMICASKPKSLVDALQKAGYGAELTEDDSGDPMINSSAAGYSFSILFYGCDNGAKCDAVQFDANFEAHAGVTPAYVNGWNSDKRFVVASVNDEKELRLRYDLTTIGGLTQSNFSEVLDWWSRLLRDYEVYAGENLK